MSFALPFLRKMSFGLLIFLKIAWLTIRKKFYIYVKHILLGECVVKIEFEEKNVSTIAKYELRFVVQRKSI